MPIIKTDIAIIGGGIAGITLALDLLDQGEQRSILLLDAQSEDNFGGLAKGAFGGMMFVDTPLQRKSGIRDSSELALRDWENFAEFGAGDHWPRAWAKYYVENVTGQVHDWIRGLGLKFLPAVQWVERGLYQPGNSVPRYHIIFGTAQHLITILIARLKEAAKDGHLTLLFNHQVRNLSVRQGQVTGFDGHDLNTDSPFTVEAATTVIATGGIGGNVDKVIQNWSREWGNPPDKILNGCHPTADGHLHDQVTELGGQVTHLDKMWNYAAGIAHPQPDFDGHGLSLVPTRSSLWMDHKGQRIGPQPLITGFDTNYLCQQLAAQEKPWSWQVMNWKIASRELAISGADHNPDLRDRKFLKLIVKLLLADDGLLRQMVATSEDFIVADTLPELTAKMNKLTGKDYISAPFMEQQISAYDSRLARGPKLHNDDQIRRIAQLRAWGGDRIRTCKFQQILDKKAGPLVAIRTHLITRKSLGGIQTNLDCAVLKADGSQISGLYAVGEATGFGGGGASGKRSLEGTFLSGCILTARRAAEVISGSLKVTS
ncbi:MAG: FAD-binding dehydrogenase [Alphaproteobacteria bacterium]|nr:MAG: FAD-binding dehydrogenase [Alphaproteobacteria bacterium]